MTMTDFSHLHELEERAKRTQSQMLRVQKNDAEWNQLAIQLFQTEQEIADERTFLGLKDMDASKLYAELLDDHESEVAMQIIEILNGWGKVPLNGGNLAECFDPKTICT